MHSWKSIRRVHTVQFITKQVKDMSFWSCRSNNAVVTHYRESFQTSQRGVSLLERSKSLSAVILAEYYLYFSLCDYVTVNGRKCSDSGPRKINTYCINTAFFLWFLNQKNVKNILILHQLFVLYFSRKFKKSEFHSSTSIVVTPRKGVRCIN